MKLTRIFIVLICFSVSLASAQSAINTINQLKNNTQATVTLNSSTGFVEFVKFPIHQPLALEGNSLQEKASLFLERYSEIYNIKNHISSFVFEELKTDNYGFKRLVLNQTYNGVDVFDSKLMFHFNASQELTAINGNVIPQIKINEIPVLSVSEANTKAINIIHTQDINFSGEQLLIHSTKLYVFPKGLVQGYVNSHHLVYEVEVRNNLDVREFLYIDAHSGVLIEQFTGIAHALDRRLYENNQSNLIWQEGDALPGTLNQWQQNEVIVSEHMYNLFNNTFGYASYDGADAQMRTINNNPNISCPNASWNGSTANYCTGTASDDVIAHEWGHAYTQYTSGLIYAYQSGAINESYSDIWGETVDMLNNYQDAGEDMSLRTACFSSVRWRMGEDASAFGNPIRDMWNPTCNGDPGKVTDGQYSCGDFDNGGVHINSGIPNHAYALIVDGGSYNGQTINGIGFTKAAHIFWRAQSTYLTSTSDFSVLADALEASCNDLIGIDLEGLSFIGIPSGSSGEIISIADCQEVVKAILAVEMRIDPEICGYEPILEPSDPLCNAASTGRVFFEDWETGTSGWSFSQLQTGATWTPRDWQLDANLPDGRDGNAIYAINAPIGELYGGDCTTDFQNGIMRLESPLILLPDVTEGHFDLAFNHYISTEPDWDGGNLKYSLDGGEWTLIPSYAFTVNPYNGNINSAALGNDNPMERQQAFTGSDEGSNLGSWGTSVVDLSELGAQANSTVQFRWELGTDGCNGKIGWYVDDVIVYNCAAEFLSVDEYDGINHIIKVYPNPSTGIFTLQKLAQIDLLKADIYDLNGRIIKSIDLKNMSLQEAIDLSGAASGIYFMEVSTQNTKTTIKLIKN